MRSLLSQTTLAAPMRSGPRRAPIQASIPSLERSTTFAVSCPRRAPRESRSHSILPCSARLTKEHPEWFEWRQDGSIKFSENPPKKYEDIVNVRFDGDAFPAVWYASREVVLFWLDQGVKIFRVDNPHTKPIPSGNGSSAK
jgi:hypothetical protein